MKIIAFTGMPCSGKSVAVQVAQESGIPVIRMGDMVWEETKRQGKTLTDKTVGDIATSMRKQHGMDIWAKRTVKKIKTLSHAQLFVIDGVRNKEEIDYFRKKLGNDFRIVAIEASDEVRRKRALARKRADDATTLHDLEERDKREIGWGLKNVIALADIILSNEGNVEEFKKQVATVLQTLEEAIP